MDKWMAMVVSVSVVCMASIVIYALRMGHDGVLVTASVTAIGSTVAGVLAYRAGCNSAKKDERNG